LQLVQQQNVDFTIVEYLKNPPTQDELTAILDNLGMAPLELIRTKEKIFKELNLSKTDQRSDAEWIKIMVSNPVLIERPLFIYNNKTVLGRPPDKVLDIL
jgi:arsenate reductase